MSLPYIKHGNKEHVIDGKLDMAGLPAKVTVGFRTDDKSNVAVVCPDKQQFNNSDSNEVEGVPVMAGEYNGMCSGQIFRFELTGKSGKKSKATKDVRAKNEKAEIVKATPHVTRKKLSVKNTPESTGTPAPDSLDGGNAK